MTPENVSSTGFADLPQLVAKMLSIRYKTPLSTNVAAADLYIPANLRTSLPKNSIVRRDREIGHHVQYVTSANGITSNHGDDRLRATAHLYVQIKNPQSWHIFRAVVITSFPADALVSTRAKR